MEAAFEDITRNCDYFDLKKSISFGIPSSSVQDMKELGVDCLINTAMKRNKND